MQLLFGCVLGCFRYRVRHKARKILKIKVFIKAYTGHDPTPFQVRYHLTYVYIYRLFIERTRVMRKRNISIYRAQTY